MVVNNKVLVEFWDAEGEIIRVMIDTDEEANHIIGFTIKDERYGCFKEDLETAINQLNLNFEE